MDRYVDQLRVGEMALASREANTEARILNPVFAHGLGIDDNDPPYFDGFEPVTLLDGMTFALHPVFRSSDSGLTACVGDTFAVTAGQIVRLGRTDYVTPAEFANFIPQHEASDQ